MILPCWPTSVLWCKVISSSSDNTVCAKHTENLDWFVKPLSLTCSSYDASLCSRRYNKSQNIMSVMLILLTMNALWSLLLQIDATGQQYLLKESHSLFSLNFHLVLYLYVEQKCKYRRRLGTHSFWIPK